MKTPKRTFVAGKKRFTKRYVQLMAANAGLSVKVYTPGDRITRYDLFDSRDAQKIHRLFGAYGGAEAGAFISGYLVGRNREIIG